MERITALEHVKYVILLYYYFEGKRSITTKNALNRSQKAC
jgi:hypothetical protein